MQCKDVRYLVQFVAGIECTIPYTIRVTHSQFCQYVPSILHISSAKVCIFRQNCEDAPTDLKPDTKVNKLESM